MKLPLRQLKRLVIITIGASILLVGMVMIFLPAPSCIVIPAGLAILAIELEWARRLLKKTKTFYKSQAKLWKRKNNNHNHKTGSQDSESA